MHGVVAAAGGDDLHFQVVVIEDALLDEHARVVELALRVVADAPVRLPEAVHVVHFVDTHAAAAGAGLDQHHGPGHALLLLVVEELLADGLGFHLVIDGAVAAGHRGHAQAAGQPLGVDLVAQVADDAPGGTDEVHGPGTLHHAPGKAVVLREEPVAGVDGSGACGVGSGEDVSGVQVVVDAHQRRFPAQGSG